MKYFFIRRLDQKKNKSLSEIYFNVLFLVYGISIVLLDNIEFLFLLHSVHALLGISFLFLIRKDKIYANFFLKIYLLFTILAIVSIFWSDYFLHTSKRSLTLLLIFINITIIYNINKIYGNYLYLVYGIFIAIFINFLWLLNVVDLGLNYEGWRFQGSVLQANEFAFILMFTMIMIIYLLNSKAIGLLVRFLLIILFLISLYLVFFTASKSGIIGSVILISLFFYQIVNLRNTVIIFLILITGYGVLTSSSFVEFISNKTTFNLEDTYENIFSRMELFLAVISEMDSNMTTSTGLRINSLQKGFEMWTNRPILGNGMAVFEAKYGGYSHNNIVELLLSVGILGFLLFYSLYVILFIKILKIRAIKPKVFFLTFLLLFFLFDQSIVSYYGKFEILSLLIFFFSIEETIKRDRLDRLKIVRLDKVSNIKKEKV